MAVSGAGGPHPPGLFRALRALVEAHGRSSMNAALREAGMALSLLAAVATVGVYVVLVGAFTAMGVGLGFAATLRDVDPRTAVALVDTVVPLVGVLLSLLTGDGGTFDAEKLDAYPVPRKVLFVAEALAGLLQPAIASGAMALVAFSAVVAARRPAEAPGVIAAGVTAVATLWALRAVLAESLQWLFSRLRGVMLVVLMFLPVAVSASVVRPSAGVQPLLTSLVEEVVPLLPATAQLDALSREPWWLGLVWPALVPVALWAWAYRLASAPRRAENAPARARPERLWTFGSPAAGVARLHLTSILSTELGRLTVALPVLWALPLLLVRTRVVAGLGGDASSYFLWLMAPAMMVSLVLNQFGTDRGAVKALLLLPVSEEVLLRGKALALAAIMGLNGAGLAVLTVLFAPRAVEVRFLGPLALAIIFTVQLAVGQWTSVLWPRPIPRKGLRQPPGGLLLGLTSMATVVGVMGPLGVAFWQLGDRPVALAAVLGAVLAIVLVLVRLTSRQAALFLATRREKLVETLS